MTKSVVFPLVALCLLVRPVFSAIDERPMPSNLYKCYSRMSLLGAEESSSRSMSHCTQLFMIRSSLQRWSGWNASTTWTEEIFSRAADDYIRSRIGAFSRFQTAASGAPTHPGETRRVRKEYRALTDVERNNYHRAINLLKRDTTVHPNKYDALAFLHRGVPALNAHGGPPFIIWHRIYVLMFEHALREKISSVVVPYWDVTIDSMLSDPRTSNVWTSQFMGNGDGLVVTGPFANWQTPSGPLIREFGALGELPTKKAIENVLSRRYLAEISDPSAEIKYNLELYHNEMHVWIGGQVSELDTAPFDPSFWLIHGFVDYVWYRFHENQRKLNIDPSTDYPAVFGDDVYGPNESIGLRNITVLESLKMGIGYTDNLYTYDYSHAMPCSTSCGSPYLKCVKNSCIPKTSAMTNYGDLTPMQNNFCINKYCDINQWVFLPVNVIYTRPDNGNIYSSYAIHAGKASTTEDIYNPDQYTTMRPLVANSSANRQLTCHRSSCCGSAGAVFIRTNGLNYQGVYKDFAIVDRRYAISSSVSYVAIKSPDYGATVVMISASDRCGRVCKPTCLVPGSSPPQYRFCSGIFRITSSFPQPYGKTLGEAYSKVWDFSNHVGPIRYNPGSIAVQFECDTKTGWPFVKQRTTPSPPITVAPVEKTCSLTPRCSVKGSCTTCFGLEKRPCLGSCHLYAQCVFGYYFTIRSCYGQIFSNSLQRCIRGTCLY